jgi:hypothetical protein
MKSFLSLALGALIAASVVLSCSGKAYAAPAAKNPEEVALRAELKQLRADAKARKAEARIEKLRAQIAAERAKQAEAAK